MSVYAEVAFALPIDQSYTYSVPDGLAPRLEVGVRVLAPFCRQAVSSSRPCRRSRTKTRFFPPSF
jgi:primosomal protein N'